MGIKLSFCIPTYNFADFIGETLESIIIQATDEVAVIIVDGGSTDNTREIVESYQKKFPRILYFLRDKNIGVDRDLAKTVELATGDYCWFMSSDDKLSPGAIKKVLDEIKYGHDIYLCNRMECDFNLRPIRKRLWFSPGTADKVFDFTGRNELIAYLGSSRSIGALFSYCSSIIFNRQKWNKVNCPELFMETGYAHVYRLFSFTGIECKIKYIKDALVLCRGDNDSFLANGLVRRFMLDIDGYRLLADNLFNNDPELRIAFLSVLRREVRLHYLIKVRSSAGDMGLWGMIEKKLISCGYSPLTLCVARKVGALKLFVSAAFYIKHKIEDMLVS
mgnify:CR=1 FL=1